MEARSDMGDPMARADKLRLQKQVLVIFGNELFGSMLSHAIFENLQVSDLVELTKQQAVTIRRLERDSLAKSDRIADIETRCRCKLQMSLNPFSILQSWCFPLLLLPPPLLSPLCPNASAFPEDARPSKVIKI